MADNATFIRSLYDAFGRGDVKTILDNLDPAVEWTSHGDSDRVPWSGTRRGLDGALSFFQLLGEYLDFEVFEPGQFFTSGDAVIVRGYTRARHKKAGHGVYASEWAHFFTIRGGKLARFEEFYDTAAIERALAA